MRSQEARAVIPFVSRLSRAASEGGSPMAKSVYDEPYTRSMKDPEGFWARAAEAIHWEKRWDRVFDDSRKPFHRWFTGGVLNTCYNALDCTSTAGAASSARSSTTAPSPTPSASS